MMISEVPKRYSEIFKAEYTLSIYKGIQLIKPNSIVLKPDRPQDDRLAACVIAQQYSSATFVSLCFHYRKGKFGDVLKNVIVSILFALLKTA
jgi:hypothetical protein